MKIGSVLVWSSLYVCLSSFSSCSVKYAPPKVETCVHNQDNSAECTDLRLPENDRQYSTEKLENYICTNSDDYGLLYSYAANLREKLIKCENQPKRK